MSLKESSLFKDLSQDVVQEISNSGSRESYAQGQFIIREGETADHFFVLLKGRVRLSVGEGSQLTFTISNVGEAFGWSSLVHRDAYTASAESLTSSELIKLDKGALDKIFEKDPASGMIFFRRLAGVIAQRLVNSYNTLLSAYQAEGPPSYG